MTTSALIATSRSSGPPAASSDRRLRCSASPVTGLARPITTTLHPALPVASS
ncbi:MAG: hypothetical protein ACYCVZ_05820 [Streptosporangiaceae bacterium]